MNEGEILNILIKALNLNDQRLLRNVLESVEELLKLDVTQGLKDTPSSISLLFDKKGGLD